MTKHLPGQRLTQSHKENRPVYGMEPHYILSDQMKIRRPVTPVQIPMLPVCVITDARDIVNKSIQPDINHMSRVKCNRDPPGKGCT